MRAARWISRRFRPIAVAAAAVGLGLALWNQREALSSVDWAVHWAGLVGAVLLFGVAALGGCFAFWLILHGLTPRASLGRTTLVWVRSFLARYVPSGVLTLVVRVRAHESLGAGTGQIWAASAYEQLASGLAGASVSVAAFALASRRPPLAAWLILGTAFALALVSRRGIAARMLARVRADAPEQPIFVDVRIVLGAVLFDVAGWVVAGAAVWVLVESLLPGRVSALFLLGAYSFAWLLGFVALPVPSGFGVREGTFIALLAPEFGVGAATVLALALRLADILGEVLVLAGAEGVHALAHRLHASRTVTS